MGLSERRAISEYKEKAFADDKKKIDKAAGFPVTLDVLWDTLNVQGKAEDAEKSFKAVYVEPLLGAIGAIAVDDMGKKALKAGLKKVVIDGSDGIDGGYFTFVDGVLTLKHKVDANVDYVEGRQKAITSLFEAKL